MLKIVAVATGGAFGALLRYGVYSLLHTPGEGKFPWATFIVNCAGSFLLGMIFEIASLKIISEPARVFITIGFLGALTTFSTFSLESLQLLRSKEHVIGLVNLIGGLLAGLVLCMAGIFVGKVIIKPFLE